MEKIEANVPWSEEGKAGRSYENSLIKKHGTCENFDKKIKRHFC